MDSLTTLRLVEARHAELMRAADQARRIRAARRVGAIAPSAGPVRRWLARFAALSGRPSGGRFAQPQVEGCTR